MNINCSFCQIPYTLSRVDMLDALQEMDSKNLTHYDAHCPRCRRATPIPRKRMEMFLPNWRDALKEFETEMKQHPQQAAPAPEPTDQTQAEPASVAETEAKPQGQPAAKAASTGKSGASQKTPAAASSRKRKN